MRGEITPAPTRRAPRANGRPVKYHHDSLAVQCWCQAEIIHVPAEIIQRGETGSCGRQACVDAQSRLPLPPA